MLSQEYAQLWNLTHLKLIERGILKKPGKLGYEPDSTSREPREDEEEDEPDYNAVVSIRGSQVPLQNVS